MQNWTRESKLSVKALAPTSGRNGEFQKLKWLLRTILISRKRNDTNLEFISRWILTVLHPFIYLLSYLWNQLIPIYMPVSCPPPPFSSVKIAAHHHLILLISCRWTSRLWLSVYFVSLFSFDPLSVCKVMSFGSCIREDPRDSWFCLKGPSYCAL